jgi:hypothetical protein
MPKLTVNYSKTLLNLLDSGDELPIDGIEVGPWFKPQEIAKFKGELPGWPFHFHASSLLWRQRYWPGANKRLEEYLSCTMNEWLSLHIELLPLHIFLISRRLGIHLPPPDKGRAIRQFVQAIEKASHEVTIPIILENLASLPVEKYRYAADPKVIHEVIESTDSGLLLDLAHARLAASYQDQTTENYLRQLPLDRVQQIHISGVRLVNGHLQDAHESMDEEDYKLLRWALENCEPTMITLEYFREPQVLREQILRIREVIGSRYHYQKQNIRHKYGGAINKNKLKTIINVDAE